MNKAYKFRAYPNDEQIVLINKTIGSARFVYNNLLTDCKEQYKETGKFKMKTPAILKKDNDFLKEVDSLALCNSQMNLQRAYSNFFNSQKSKGKKTGEPHFHSKKSSKQSYTTNCINNSIRIEDGKLRLPKIGKLPTLGLEIARNLKKPRLRASNEVFEQIQRIIFFLLISLCQVLDQARSGP